MSFMDVNPDIVRLRRSIGEPILYWTPDGLCTPTRVYSTRLGLAGQGPEFEGFEGAAPHLVDRVQAFLVSERFRIREEQEDRAHEAGYADGGAPQPHRGGGEGVESVDGPGAGDLADGGAGSGADFQRKIVTADLEAEMLLGGQDLGRGLGALLGEGLGGLGPGLADGAVLSLVMSGLEDALQAAQGQGAQGQGAKGQGAQGQGAAGTAEAASGAEAAVASDGDVQQMIRCVGSAWQRVEVWKDGSLGVLGPD